VSGVSIRLEQVSVHEGDDALVNDCTLSIASGERFVLLGPEGAGKGVLLRVIAGFCPVDHGRVLLDGRDVTRVPASLRGVGIVLREPALFNRMSVAENVTFALGSQGVPAAERERRAHELLELTALGALGGQYPARLSAAQRYRTAIARALARAPRLLLLEDPCAGLDRHELAELQDTLARARNRFQTTVLLTTAEPAAAVRLADCIGVMSAGRVLETGSPEALYSRPRTRIAARSLGMVNLLTGQLEPDGVRLGGHVFSLADHPVPVRAVPSHATVLVRPEDVALATAADGLPGPAVATGTIERIERCAQSQRLHVSCEGLGLDTGDSSEATVSSTSILVMRPAAQARLAPLVPGQRVVIGLRRIHVLPSQLCSLWLAAGSRTAGEAFAGSRVVRALSAGMQVAPSFVAALRHGAALPPTALCAVSGWGREGVEAVHRLLELGARQVLLLRDPDRPVRQMWLRSQPARAAREGMLSIGASLLRYLPMEAILLVPDLPRQVRGGRFRMLLDLRRAALEHHGLDLRTELQPFALQPALRARLRQASGPVLLALGAVSPACAREVLAPVVELLSDRTPLGALLITCARTRSEAVVTSITEPGHLAVA
jgi:ABC-type sulfate/molybdate transport systems ATPase subunit